ncbi:MAG: DNA polymerase V, partial [Neisseria sp.]
KPELHSENASGEYPDFVPDESDTWTIVGVVTFVIKDVRQGS